MLLCILHNDRTIGIEGQSTAFLTLDTRGLPLPVNSSAVWVETTGLTGLYFAKTATSKDKFLTHPCSVNLIYPRTVMSCLVCGQAHLSTLLGSQT